MPGVTRAEALHGRVMGADKAAGGGGDRTPLSGRRMGLTLGNVAHTYGCGRGQRCGHGDVTGTKEGHFSFCYELKWFTDGNKKLKKWKLNGPNET